MALIVRKVCLFFKRRLFFHATILKLLTSTLQAITIKTILRNLTITDYEKAI